jgi:STE24 endopeptidase
MLLGMIGLALVWIAQLPFELADTWWQRRYGIVKGGYLEWLLENWVALGAGFLFICLWLLITMALAAPLRDNWWIGAAPVFAGLALFFAFLSPYLVPDQRDPDPALAADARRIARATGQEGVELKVQRIGNLTRAPNAFAAGIGPSRRVVLWDTLLERPFTRDEVRVVLAHEYGHQEKNHIWKGVAWYGLLSLPVLALVARAARRWGGLYTPRAVPVALFSLVLISVVTQPFGNLVTRRMEAEADWVALQTTCDPAAARKLFERFTEVALSEPDPPQWSHVVFDTHPSIDERIAEANAWERRSGSRSCRGRAHPSG